jgi:hypothetical protein
VSVETAEAGVIGVCAELPWRVAAAQCFAITMVGLIAECRGGLRELARAVGVDEKTARRWLGLLQGELRPVGKINAIVAKLGKLARREIRTARLRMTLDHGPAGDRQAIASYLSLLFGAEKPIIPSSAETLGLPVALLLGGLVVVVVRTLGDSMKRALAKKARAEGLSVG